MVFHLVTITIWAIPAANPVTLAVRSLVRPYFLWTGLFQSWDTFAPSPRSINSYVTAAVTYEDGSAEKWPFPRMEQLSLGERYRKERYRKYVENLESEQNEALWPDAARAIARRCRGPAPVRSVMLVRFWSQIDPKRAESEGPAPWDLHVLYRYRVTPEDLE